MTQLGFTALLIALFSSGYAVLADIMGARRHDEGLIKSACNAAQVNFACLSIAAASLTALLINSDFSVIYVANHTSRALPLLYKISALWAGAPGSLLFWTWMQAGFVIAVFARKSIRHQDFYITARSIGNFISLFFMLVLILDKNPFALLPVTPDDGAGLNPLLQHPAMALHPPTLFAGYAACIIPFAWALASLKHNNAHPHPMLFNQIQIWIVRAWMFLTIGIALGAWWAYEELGWGGYWSWDPVENSSLLPWLIATALLHGSRTYRKNTSMATWVNVLSLLTFSLCIFATFLTRYGLVSSVHAFPEPGLGILFLVLLVLLWIIAVVLGLRRLIGKRTPVQPSSHPGHRFIVWNNWLLILLTIVILIGTLFPFLSGLVTSRKISLKPEYFTKITAPGGLALLLLLAICPHLVRYGLKKKQRMIAAIATTLAALAGWRLTHSLAIPFIILCAFAMLNLFVDAALRYRTKRKAAPGTSGIGVNLRWCGARLVHLGIVLTFLGIAGSGGFGIEKQFALTPGDSIRVADLIFTYHDLYADHGPNYTAVSAEISVAKSYNHPPSDGPQTNPPKNPELPPSAAAPPEPFARLYPSMAVYETSGKQTSEVDIKRTLARDVYVALTQVSSSDKMINLTILIKPLINWIWIGAILTVMGAILIQIALMKTKKPVANQQSELLI